MATPEALILGGGLAGLAAAVRLTRNGWHVTVAEQRSFCGGRAYTFREPQTHEFVDNGQHLLMGCYRETFDFLETIGTRSLIDIAPQLQVLLLQRDGTHHTLHCPQWPTPWHLAAGLSCLRGFGPRNLWRLRKALRHLRHFTFADYQQLDQLSVTEWLTTLQQDTTAQAIFWEPLTLAIMNESPDRASAAALAMMLKEGMFTRQVPQGLGFPRAPLSQIFVEPALALLERGGATILTSTAIERITMVDGRVSDAVTSAGKTLTADAIIITLPPRDLARLCAASGLADVAPWNTLAQWQTVPIVSAHLWFDRPIMSAPMIGLLDAPFHWAFDKTQLLQSDVSAVTPRQCIALVSSACRALANTSRETLRAMALTTIEQFFPSARGVTPQHIQVTKELHATVSIAHGSATRRLPSATPWSNAFLAGDWTQTYLPATIESAVRSGHAAATLAMTTADTPRKNSMYQRTHFR